ncbi:MAG: LLM class flavin-dependent oxidoreductase [Anaerolineales bacterium]|nr:LLM class flavin-dependent oxidoreductase [Anaerolineales bacterium]
MEFGFGHHINDDYRKHIELAQLGEALGFDFFWLPDQTFFPDPYIVLGLVAQATQKIQVGLAVTNPHTRHPAISARSVGTLGQIAPGRVHLGIGAGNQKELILPLGLDGDHVGSKLREMLEIIRGLLTGERLVYRGKYFQVDGVKLDFPPPAPIPIYMAGRGTYVLQSAGELADGVIIGAICNKRGIDFAIEQVRLGTAKSGRALAETRIVSWLTVILTEDRDSALQGVRSSVAHIIGGAPDEVLENVGLDMELIRRIKEVYWKVGIAQAGELVTVDCIDAFTIIGDARAIIDRVQMLREAGVNQLSINLGDAMVEQHKQRLQAFAQAVLPAFA